MPCKVSRILMPPFLLCKAQYGPELPHTADRLGCCTCSAAHVRGTRLSSCPRTRLFEEAISIVHLVCQEMEAAGAMQVLVDALEVWDYSRYNIQGYARRVIEAQPRLRYLPFSFLSTKSDLALGVDSFSR